MKSSYFNLASFSKTFSLGNDDSNQILAVWTLTDKDLINTYKYKPAPQMSLILAAS